jgi:hypothetical protein
MSNHRPDPERLDRTEQSGRPLLPMAGIALLVLALLAMVVVFVLTT